MKRVVDLFAGCGGLSLGFEKAGYDVIAAFELWETAAKCYEQNFSHPVYRTDLSDVNATLKEVRRLQPEVIIGGPPCQDFSYAGKRIEAGRASLTGAYAQIIAEYLPKYFIMENVDRAQKSNAYATARKILKKAGYGLTEVILDASRCGVPQKRKRFFCIGSIGQEDGFLLEYINAHLSKNERTLRDHFGEALDFQYYYRHPRTYNRRGIFSIDEPAPTIRGVNRPVPQGYLGHSNDPCPLDDSIRALTTLERASIQTFPSAYKWVGNKTDVEQMIGNAVPVDLAKFVGEMLMHHIEMCECHMPDYSAFVSWLRRTQSLAERTVSDMASRLKRANAICQIHDVPTAYYIFQLEQCDAFDMLTQTVKSQLKRSIILYSEFCGHPILSPTKAKACNY